MQVRQLSKPVSEVLAVEGEVDLSNSPVLRSHIKSILEPGAHNLVIDLEGVSYMDSSGIAVLIEGMRWAHKTNRSMVLAAPSDQVRMVMELAKLDSFFVTAPSVEDALAGLGAE